MWLQEKVDSGDIEIVKVRSEENLADALTKAVDAAGIRKHIEGIGAVVSQGRHPLTPKLEYGKEEEGVDDWHDNN